MSDVLITGDGQFPMDVRLPILSAQTTKEGRTEIVVQGEHRGRTVGVEISVRVQREVTDALRSVSPRATS